MSLYINDSKFHGPYPLGVVMKMWGTVIRDNPQLFVNSGQARTTAEDIDKESRITQSDNSLCLKDIPLHKNVTTEDLT